MSFELYGFWRSLATFRVRIAMNLKGLDYREHSIDLMAGEQHAAKFRSINPMAAVPALVEDGHLPITQSLAILEYLEEVYPTPALLPAEPRARAHVRELALTVAADGHPLVVPRVRNYLTDVLKLDEPTKLIWIEHWSRAALGALEVRLAPVSGPYCFGQTPTLADICLVTHVVGARLFKFDVSDFPACVRIVDRCLALEAFARAHPLKQPGAPAAH